MHHTVVSKLNRYLNLKAYSKLLLLNCVPVMAVEIIEARGEVARRDLPRDREEEHGRPLREAHCRRLCVLY